MSNAEGGNFRSDASDAGDTKSVNSWIADAIKQGGGSDLLGGRQGGSHQDHHQVSIDDEEVLEQYRMMSHFEAARRVRENTEFDMEEYNRTRKSCSEPRRKTRREYLKLTNPILPDLKSSTSSSRRSNKEPDMPETRPCKLLPPRTTNYPDIAIGSIFNESFPLDGDETTIACMDCSRACRVSSLALMMRCPECSNVTPAHRQTG